MCGIIGGITQKNNIATIMLDGLTKLEYRGYDSAGICVQQNGELVRVRRAGFVEETRAAAQQMGIAGSAGIGHTRWATHGAISEANAHPHISGDLISVVHNGVIENHHALRRELAAKGYAFTSETDTEVIAHQIHHLYTQKPQGARDLLQAAKDAAATFRGEFAFLVIAKDAPDELAFVNDGCSMIVGKGDGEIFLASDVVAVVAHTRDVMYLEQGDHGKLDKTGLAILRDGSGAEVVRPMKRSNLAISDLELGAYRYFMQKEINEQPIAISDTAEVFLDLGFVPEIFGDNAGAIFSQIDSLKILACGTSYYAALTAKYWLESIAKIRTDVEIASEYRYRQSLSNPNELIVTISQSGETLDTLEALRFAKAQGHKHTLSICNVMDSALPRASELVFYTRAGIEIGVASTKAFTTQLVALFGLTITLGRLRGAVSERKAAEYLQELRALPAHVQHVLNLEPQIALWAKKFAEKPSALFLGRGIHYPIALEGALKLKEISYIHAEAYPAGELKHGPLALVDENMPVVVIAPKDELLEKLKSNISEVRARGGELFVFADNDGDFSDEEAEFVHLIKTPQHVGVLSPIVHTVPVQLLAYRVALTLGKDVDRPRNLAKSVTVE